MNIELTQEQILVQKTAREFADFELKPGVIERDEKKIWPREAVSKMGELGFMGMMVDQNWGGEGMDTVAYSIAMEEIAKARVGGPV